MMMANVIVIDNYLMMNRMENIDYYDMLMLVVDNLLNDHI
jgi:hypothetical protein